MSKSEKAEVIAQPQATAGVKAWLNKQVAAQLTADYRQAVGGLVACVRFGARLAEVRDAIVANALATGDGDGTLKEFLTEHCPEISIPTAYRFMEMAGATRALCDVGAGTSLVTLLCASASKLAGELKKKRAQIEATLAEFGSQRQLLLAFRNETKKPKRSGGDHEFQAWLKSNFPHAAGTKLRHCDTAIQATWAAHLKQHQLPPDEIAKLETENARKAWAATAEFLRDRGLGRKRTWPRLTPSEIETLAELLGDVATAMKKSLTQI